MTMPTVKGLDALSAIGVCDMWLGLKNREGTIGLA